MAVDDVALHAALDPERLAAVELSSGRSLSYHALDDMVARTASVLASLVDGRPEARVAVRCRNRLLVPVLHLASARLGLVCCPLSFRLTDAELDRHLDAIAPALFLTDETVGTRRRPDLSLDALEARVAEAPPRASAPLEPDRPSLLLFTSGTTGQPRGALLSERNLRQSTLHFAQLGRVDRASRFLCDAPMFHVIGLSANIRPALMLGGAIVVSDGFDPAATLARLADPELAISHYFCVPQMLAALRRHPDYAPERLTRLTAIFTGGAPHPAGDVRAAVAEGLTVADGYGMTEAGTVFGMPLDRATITRKAGAVGVSPPGVQVRIVDEAGEPCPVGEAGELWLRGDAVCARYLDGPCRGADGWFQTGDLCRADDDGFHYIVGRTKDMYISGGENVYPAEVEALLAGFTGLSEVAVVGVPDARWGEVGHLAFVADGRDTPDVQGMLRLLRAKLAAYKVPKHVTELAALPRTENGKVRKDTLRATLTARPRAGYSSSMP